MDEIWKSTSFPHVFISNNGRIFREEHHINGRRVKGMYLKPSPGASGHMRVNLRVNGKPVTTYVHALVAEAFHGPRPDGMLVCHNDGDPSNNRAGNVRYDTPSGNARDKRAHGTQTYGESHCAAKLCEADVIAVLAAHREGLRPREITAKLGVPTSNVKNITSGRSWKHIPRAA